VVSLSNHKLRPFDKLRAIGGGTVAPERGNNQLRFVIPARKLESSHKDVKPHVTGGVS